jgi:carboxylesterase
MTKKSIGVLILHGFTGTPENVNTIAPPLEALGLPCSLPTLRGHGRESPEALRNVTWQEWIEDAKNALFELLEENEKAIIVGHSMGGMITLNLAVDYEEKIDSIIVAGGTTELVSPLGPGRPLHFLVPIIVKLFRKWDMPLEYADSELAQHDPAYKWAPTEAFVELFDFMKVTEQSLPEVKVPTLIMHSKNDSANSPKGVNILYRNISTPEDQKQIVWFEKTEHEMFLDCEREETVRTIVEFVNQRIQYQ